MKAKFLLAALACICLISCESQDRVQTDEILGSHNIMTYADGTLAPWNSPDPSVAFDDMLERLWSYWRQVPRGIDGTPVYMTQRLLNTAEDGNRGIGGDQFAMLLASWNLWNRYSGDPEMVAQMRYIADMYLHFGLSPADCKWPGMPFTQNTNTRVPIYDGDYILGKGFIQPDKCGSFGLELLKLYPHIGRSPLADEYLVAAVRIANTLCEHYRDGDADNSPWHFKVNVFTGEVRTKVKLLCSDKEEPYDHPHYTSNYAPTLDLLDGLCKIGVGDTLLYRQTFNKVLDWMKAYPLKNNKWGPFFEDISYWSDTQTNAVTFAQFIMDHPDLFDDWKSDVNSIFDWVYETLGNHDWEKYGVTVINEQTRFKYPGNSHTARQACAELQYVHMSADSTRYENAIRQLVWASYCVNDNGDNIYPGSGDWITDGYGDFVRHYLRAMGFCPELARSDENHIIWADCPVFNIWYGSEYIVQYTVRGKGEEHIRMSAKPSEVKFLQDGAEGDWRWEDMPQGGGLLTVTHNGGGQIKII